MAGKNWFTMLWIIIFTFVWLQDDADFFDNIDDVMDDLANLNDKSFIEYFDEEGNYKTN